MIEFLNNIEKVPNEELTKTGFQHFKVNNYNFLIHTLFTVHIQGIGCVPYNNNIKIN